MLIMISPEIRTNLSDYILKKEMSIELTISLFFINMLSGGFFFTNKMIGSHESFDTCELEVLKRIRQFYLIISLYVIVIHIEYTVWILMFSVLYIYTNICLYISQIISKKEIELYLHNSNTQSVPIDIESGTIVPSTIAVLGTPLIHNSTDHSTEHSTD